MFTDEVEVEARGGRGGQGCVSFHREKFIQFGGPDGGDGGNGGSVILTASTHTSSLFELLRRRILVAENGRQGSSSNSHGRSGEDLEIEVPVGTLVHDRDLGRVLGDLNVHGATLVVAKGGYGGRGNAHFKSSTNQTPREYEPGQVGEQRRLRLELKLMAEVGIVGLPNAGKSTFLARVSRARPKIAAYPFTTLAPELGIAELPGYRSLVIADIPGLIEGAHEGRGLGDQFLRHVERCGVLLHLVDLSTSLYDPAAPVAAYHTIRKELAAFSPELAAKPEVVAGSKTDAGDLEPARAALEAAIGRPVHGISAVAGTGVAPLLELLREVASARVDLAADDQ